MDSPIGTLGIAESEIGLRRILFQNEYPFETSLKKYYPKEEINFVQTPAKEIQNQIIAYFKGELKSFSLALDLKAPPFFKRALLEVSKIPFGQTASYKEIAKKCGNPKAMRAVGSANANNPIPLVIPCHRVLKHDGGLGGFGGGLEIKRFLLTLERQ